MVRVAPFLAHGVQQRSMSRESKRLNKASSLLDSGHVLIQHFSENATFVFPRFSR